MIRFSLTILLIASHFAQSEKSIQISWEATPSKSSNALPQLITSPLYVKAEYLNLIWSSLINEKGENIISQKINLHLNKTIFGFSAWKGILGKGGQSFVKLIINYMHYDNLHNETLNSNVYYNNNVNDLDHDLKPFENMNASKKDNHTYFDTIDLGKINLYSNILGFILTQDSVFWHYENFTAKKEEINGIKVFYEKALNETEFRLVYISMHREFNSWDEAPGALEKGFFVVNSAKKINNTVFQTGMMKVIENLHIGGKVIKIKLFKSEGRFWGNDWTKFPNGDEYKKNINNKELWEWARNTKRKKIEPINTYMKLKYHWNEYKK